MNSTPLDRVLAIDVGNTSIKLGQFAIRQPSEANPTESNGTGSLYGFPSDVLKLSSERPEMARLADWLQAETGPVLIASVCQPAQRLVEAWFGDNRPNTPVRVLDWNDFPMRIDLPYPNKVGQDRLAAAFCASSIKSPDRDAIVVDAGSAITVDLVSQSGAFQGGAIFPGWQTMSDALHRSTDLLPRLTHLEMERAPDAVGRDTADAITSGLYWGMVGATQRLIHQIAAKCDSEPEVIVAGGDMQKLALHLGEAVRCEPHLVLRGIAMTAC